MIGLRAQRLGDEPKVSPRPALSLRRNFSWTFVGNAVYALSQWVLLVVLARVGNATDIGYFSLALAVAAPVTLFFNLKLRSVQASDALEQYQFGTYLSLRIVASLLSILVIVALVWVLGYRGTSASVIVIMAIAKSLESLSDIFHGLQQRHEHMDVIAHSLLFKSAVSVAGFATAYLLTGALIVAVSSLMLAWAVVLFAYDIPRAADLVGKNGIRPIWSSEGLRLLTMLTLPLGITVALGSLSSNVPRYFIEAWLSTDDLGVFAALSYVLVAGSLIISAISQSATPRLASLYRSSRRVEHFQLTLRLLVCGVGVGLVGVVVVALVGEQLLKLLYGESYARFDDVFFWLMVDAATSYAYVFLGTALTSMGKYRIQLPVHLIGLAVLVAACCALIPRWQLTGAVWAMLVTNITQAILYALIFLILFQKSRRSMDGG